MSKIRRFITVEACELLVHSLVSSRIDYANALLYGSPDSQLHRLQRLLHTAARIITKSNSTQNISQVLYTLHWLPVKQRISYKIILLTYKALNNIGPTYLLDLLTPLRSERTLRSSSKNLLVVPKTNSRTFGDRAFSHSAPVLWNSLPEHIKLAQNINHFKSNLKTWLFKHAYSF